MWNPKSKIAEPESAVRNLKSEIPAILLSGRREYVAELTNQNTKRGPTHERVEFYLGWLSTASQNLSALSINLLKSGVLSSL